jgi:hypothetical protein
MKNGILNRLRELENKNGNALVILTKLTNGSTREMNISEYEKSCKNVRFIRMLRGNSLSEIDRFLATIDGNI